MPLKLRIHLNKQLHAVCTGMGAGFFSKLKAHSDVFGPDGAEHCALIDAFRAAPDPSDLPEATLRWLMRTWAHLGHFPEKSTLHGCMVMAYGLAKGLDELVFFQSQEMAEESDGALPSSLPYLRLGLERRALERFLSGQVRLDALTLNGQRIQEALNRLQFGTGAAADGPLGLDTTSQAQAELLRKRYVGSNLLPRLVKSISDEVFDRVRKLHEVYFGDKTLKWKLIQYYRDLQGSWSKERENADWAGVRLSHHKWLAAQWLREALTQVGAFPHDEILRDVMELQHAIHVGLSEWVMARLPEALAEARAAEHFAAVHALLFLEQKAMAALDEHDRRVMDAEDLRDNLGLIRELERAIVLRHQLMAVIVQRRAGDVDAYVRAADAVMAPHAKGATAQAIHAHNRQLLLHETGQAQAALEQGLVGIRVLSSHPKIAAGDLEAYCRQVYHALWIASELGQYQATLALVPEEFREAGKTVRNPQLEFSFLASQLAAGIFGKQDDLVREALGDLAKQLDFLRDDNSALRDWVMFQAVQWSLQQRDWALTGHFLQGAASGRPSWGLRYVAHMRLLQLLHIWATEPDLDFLGSAIASAKTFLRRREGKESFYVEVLGCLEGMVKVRMNENGTRQVALERVRKRITALVSSTKEKKQADMFPYRSYLLALCVALEKKG